MTETPFESGHSSGRDGVAAAALRSNDNVEPKAEGASRRRVHDRDRSTLTRERANPLDHQADQDDRANHHPLDHAGDDNVGTSDGELAGATVHRALRANALFSTPSKFRATGTLFYPTGTLRYTLHGTTKTNPDGSLTRQRKRDVHRRLMQLRRRAHGSFKVSGTKPSHSFETWTLTGSIEYR
jgi:hypothetical protein